MEITEERLMQALGVKRPEEQGGNGQGVADPETDPAGADSAGTQDGTGAVGDVTDSDSTQDGGLNGGADPDGGGADPEEDADGAVADSNTDGQTAGDGAAQTPEERRANAARRRQAELQTAVNNAVGQARQQWEQEEAGRQAEFFKQAGLINPFTKEPITDMEGFRAWREKQDEQKLQKELASGKLTQETLNTLIEKNPTVQDMRQAQELRRQEAERARQQSMDAEVERQLAEIRKTDPSIRTVKDLLSKPYGQELYAAVQRGNNFIDAFYLATRGQAEQAQRQAAQQAAVNNLTGKNHLRATSIGGRPGATVTDEEREMYRLFNPKASDADIQKFQNRYKKG